MKKTATFWAWFAFAALGLICYSQSTAQTAAEQDVAVVVNPKNTVDHLTLEDLTKIYRGERQYWKASLPVVILFRTPETHEREVVLRTIFRMAERSTNSIGCPRSCAPKPPFLLPRSSPAA